MKKIILLLLVAFTFSEAHSAIIKSGDEDQLSSLLDSFSVSMVKKDKIWMGANIADKFSVKFRKSDKGWQISEVLIN